MNHNIIESSREYDDLFQLTDRSKKVGDSYTSYIWRIDRPLFFKGCNTLKVFPLSINLYLKSCTDVELGDLLQKKHYLRVRMYHDGDSSFISVSNLDILGANDQRYRQLLLSCPAELIPVEINLGPMWHYLGASRQMCKSRRIELAYTDQIDTIFGLILLGRDFYPGESEAAILEAEKAEDIFIIRKSNP